MFVILPFRLRVFDFFCFGSVITFFSNTSIVFKPAESGKRNIELLGQHGHVSKSHKAYRFLTLVANLFRQELVFQPTFS